MDARVREVLRRAHFEPHPARFAIVGLPARADTTVMHLGPWSAALQTGDEVTYVLPEQDWDRAAARFPDAKVERGWRLIAVQVKMPWELAGMLAALTGALAQRGIPCSVLCTFSTDHILVPEARLQEALKALRALRTERV
ncbi:MAG TPA: ACT domain-containing protein [Candidatus Thermoplasmatota archaeon]|nr:ACT domain-containing protein [Candidatus Thermoplasmatota archaeon]